MAFSKFSLQDCPDTGRSIEAYIIFYQGGTIYHGKHVPVPFAESSAESEYNAACTAGTYLAHFRMLIHECLNKYPEIVPEEAPLIILDGKSSVFMDNNGNNTNHTRHISRRVNSVINGENCRCTRFTGVKEVCNWQIFQLRMLVRNI